MRRDAERLRKLRVVVRHLITQDALEHGYQATIAKHFQLSRQRVHQVVLEERERRETDFVAQGRPGS